MEDWVQDFKNGILELDLRDVDELSSPMFPEVKKLVEKYNFKRLIIYTKYLTKQYDTKLNLISIEPFFMDVTLQNRDGKYKVLDSYTNSSISVKILEYDGLVENYYELSIGEYKFPIKVLKFLYGEVKKYEKTGKTDNPIISRWYKKFGILEYLMKDEKILEININPPGFETPIRIVHEVYGECVTNIYPSQSFLDYFVTQLKMKSGRPLNKISPELDTEIKVENINARIAVISDPFSIFGVGFSIRKHRENPWTFELFMNNKTINPEFSGFMSLIITHGRSYLFAGPRGSGKTSLLVASMLQIPTNDRIITIEDTQEIPIKSFKKLGYDILPLKVRSALMEEGMEIDFEKGLRTTLRLGDSCLILGEIRGKEAKVLYEAMRVGAMSNVVAGTIHADTAYGVYDRVVNDLGVTKGSFKVTDLIILVSLITDNSGTRKIRRITEVVEVLKDWEDEPKFQSLFKYNSKTDNLEPTDVLLKGNSIILKTLIKKSKNYEDSFDVLKDWEIRTNIKKITLRNIKKSKQLEAIHTKTMDTIFLKLFRNIDNYKDEKEIKKLYFEYEKSIRQYLRNIK